VGAGGKVPGDIVIYIYPPIPACKFTILVAPAVSIF
jgi:hypothetical protein